MIITSSTLRDLHPRRKKYTTSCQANPGFQVTVYPNGTQTFAFRRKVGGRPQRQALGDDFSRAQELYRALRDTQPTPEAPRIPLLRPDVAPEDRLFREGHTWVTLSEKWLSEYVAANLTAKTYQNYELHLRRVTEAGGLPDDRAAARVKLKGLLLNVARRTPIQANRMRKCLHKLFDWAMTWDYVTDTPVYAMPAFEESTPRERRLRDEELGRLLPYLDQCQMDTDKRDVIKLQLLTGLRSGEALSLRSEWINYPALRVEIPETKNGRPFVLALSETSADLLRQMETRASGPRLSRATPWGLRQSLRRACEAVAIDRACPHDLRRTCATLCGQLGVSMEVISRVLNHTSSSVTARHYALYDMEDEKRDALERVAAHLRGLGLRVS